MVSTVSSHSSSNALLQNEEAEEFRVLYFPQNIKKPVSFWLTITLSLLYLICLVVFAPFQFYCSSSQCTGIGSSSIQFTSIILYLLTTLITLIIHFDLKKLQRNGYTRFHKEIRCLIIVPVVVFSLGNIALLTYMVILMGLDVRMISFEGLVKAQKIHSSLLFFIGFQLILAFEIVISLYFLFVLAVKLHRFSSSRRPPDLLEEEARPLQDDALNVAVTTPVAPEDTITELQEQKIDFFMRRCRLLTKGIQHVIKSLPPSLKTSTETSLQEFFDEYSEGDSINEAVVDDNDQHSDDDYLISA